MSLKIIDKNIKTVVTTGTRLNKLIHDTAMLIAGHALEHSDCTRALTLVKAMPASMRRTMLVLWFNTYTPIRVVEKNDKVGMVKENKPGYTPFDLDAGQLTPFYELAEQNPEGSVMDFAKLVELVQRVSKQIDKKLDDDKIAPEDVASARLMSDTIKALSFRRVTASNDDKASDVTPAAVG
jgi:hypothetical protein